MCVYLCCLHECVLYLYVCFEQVVEIKNKNYSTTPFAFQKVTEKVTYGLYRLWL
jgi:hypothetical protein